VLVELLNDGDESQIDGQVGLVGFQLWSEVWWRFLEDFGESGEKAYRTVVCRDIRCARF
jgi:hypothetical protein